MGGTLASEMARAATGTIEVHRWRDGRTVTVRARVRAYGRRWRIDFGTNHEGWNQERARVELDRILEQIERGTWVPPVTGKQDESGIDPHETVKVTAYRWWQRRKAELAETTRADYRWRLRFVIDQLGNSLTAELDARQVDDLRQHLVASGLSPRSVNMVLDLLAQALDDAVEYGLLSANPARGRRRRMKVPKSRRTFLEPDMVVDLLEVAGAWEREVPYHQRYGRRAVLATLCLGGPRIGELTSVPRGRLDLHGGRLRVGEAKTEAGLRDLELSAFLADELRAHLAGIPARLREAHGPALPVFPTSKGGPLNASNIRNRLLAETVRRVNEKRARGGQMLLPEKVTPHTLRRTFASLALAAGRDPRWVMAQLGHSDARLTLNIYAQVIQRKRVDEAVIWTLMRFPDEAENRGAGRAIGPTNDPTAVRDA